jgi:hypothetical protein
MGPTECHGIGAETITGLLFDLGIPDFGLLWAFSKFKLLLMQGTE